MKLANKILGETPLQCINRLKADNVFDVDASVTYAGRLDPAAEGLMLFLDNKEEIAEKDKYLGMDKEYIYEMLVGVSTDTYDLLGLIKESRREEIEVERMKDAITNAVGIFNLQYPVFSGKSVGGKKLFEYGKNGVKDIDIPVREMQVFAHIFLESLSVSVSEIVIRANKILSVVQGDFRQKEIAESWSNFEEKHKNENFVLIKSSMKCASGTYVRALINKISIDLDIPICTYSIFRSKIGDFNTEVYNRTK